MYPKVKMKAVLFCRVSSKEQEETGFSLPAQEKLLKSYAQKKDFNVSKIFLVSESASGRKQRAVFSTMMGYVSKNNIKIIICEKVDRLTRNFKDAVSIDDWLEEDEERQVHLVKDSLVLHKNSRSQEKLNWGIRILFAKNHIDNLSEEVKKGQKEKLRQGWLPTKPPIGYKTVGEQGHKIHVVDKEMATFVKKMFDLYASGNYSLNSLTEVLYKEGLRNDNGSKVVKSRIHYLLTEPFYIGKNRWNDELYDGKQETFIDRETFNRVQKILTSKSTPTYSKHNFLFKGLIKCKECTGLITWEIQKGIIYGHCNHYRNCSQKTWVKEDEVEEQILKVFVGLQIKNKRMMEWIRKALLDSHKDEIEYRTSAMEELNKRQERLKQQLDRLYDDKVSGEVKEDFYKRKFRQYSHELEYVTESITNHNQKGIKYFELGMKIYDFSQRAKNVYIEKKEKGLLEEQKKSIRFVFDSLTLNEGELNYTYTKAFELLSKAVIATNRSKMVDLEKIDGKISEPLKNFNRSDKTGDLERQRPNWLARWDDFRTYYST